MSRNGLFTSKEDTQFKELLKLYEEKHYKKSLKVLDQTLKKNGNHVESLALKGLVLYYMDELVSAKNYIAKSISKSEFNAVANHIVAIYYRNLKDYPEAAKWFKAAIDHGSKNNNIARELAIVQSQNRDFRGLVVSRLQHLEQNAGFRASWTAAGIAHHLNKDHKAAEKVLSQLETLIEGKLNDSDLYENSECLLYKNQIIADTGDFERALKNLEYAKEKIFDKQALMQFQANYLMNTGQFKDASVLYRKLLKRNPDNKEYYYQLEKSLQIDPTDIEKRLQLYAKLAKFYPKSDPVHFIPLQFLPQGEELKLRLTKYIISQLQRGVPSTFVNVKPLYKQSFKLQLIEEIVLNFFENDLNLNPLTYCWTCYFLAQHYLNTKDLINANKYIDLALAHTPTLVELYILKARILKHENKLKEALAKMNEGRLLDLQDRFINSKTTKYYLRANMIDEAVSTISLFTKVEKELVNGVQDLHLMQCCWFIMESAEAYYRLYQEEKDKNLKGLSLKRFHAIDKIYQEFWNDQIDFHSYCMRKGTPRQYIEMLKWGDELFNDAFYNRALQGLYKLYMLPDVVVEEPSEEDKKKKKKLSKQDMKKRDEFVLKVSSIKKDEDPLGLKLLEEDPVEAFGVFLSKCSNEFFSTLYMNFKYYLKVEKYVIALLQINKIHKKNPDGKLIYVLLLELKVSEKDEKIAKLVDLSINKNFPQFGGKSMDEFKEICIEEVLKLGVEESELIVEYINSIDKSNETINSKFEDILAQIDPLQVSRLQLLTL